jgi:hypothetical protein
MMFLLLEPLGFDREEEVFRSSQDVHRRVHGSRIKPRIDIKGPRDACAGAEAEDSLSLTSMLWDA